ncbi:HAMP domain-containing protein [Anabaena sp. UHCC 0187]|uniref:adenylate/guanylate cyclase domain-containing protein n=1 Tax=Anabaena sp. UHCC 0187 TaxID=2590018 RepID=UPI001447E9DB|nr:adenylate/guanylate cyclase domain-containing protein [Anabaena sp. UHCC 0187]MTJ13142.1 HAMP domain-containing protein [Anabaena sp. UHCC 0187]
MFFKPAKTNPVKSSISKTPAARIKKFPLRTTLIVPFILQVTTAVGLVGYLSFKNGQQAVNDLANQLQSQVQERVSERLEAYLVTPHQVNEINIEAMKLGLIKGQGTNTTRFFWKQMKTFKNLSYINFGTETGKFLGIGREDNGDLYLELTKPNQVNNYVRYALDGQGNPTRTIAEENYAFREQEWYSNAATAGRPTWSSVYQWSDRPDVLSISSSYPVYNQANRLVGVLGIDFILSQVSTFLQGLKITKSGRVFIIERNGLIVSSSSAEKPYIEVNGKAERLSSRSSQDPIIQATARHLESHFQNLDTVKTAQQLDFKLNNGERVFVHIKPWQDALGLNWLIITSVPESDFMGQINISKNNTILLCFLTFLATIVIAIFTSRRIIDPVMTLSQAANEIANGNLDTLVVFNDTFQIIEIDNLADLFNNMSSQLKTSFNILEAQKNSFARFFPPEYLKFFDKQSVIDIELGDHISKEMAVMFSDIRSFTTLSEKMTPKENFDFVNAYLHRVSPEIRAHNGFIVKFLGDGMMAVFPNSVDDAVASGIAKFKQVQEYNRHREAEGFLPIEVGMGIHFGHIMMGIVGEDHRIEGDALSDNVNLTARLEGLTKYYGISLLISENVLQRLSNPHQYKIRFLDRVIVKGRTEPIAIYEVLNAAPESIQALKLQTIAIFDSGQKHYNQGNFTAAKDYFQQVLVVNPLDKTAKLYLERVQQLLVKGTPENWSGIWAFEEK